MEDNKVLQFIKDQDINQLEILTESGYDFSSLNRRKSLISHLLEGATSENQTLLDILELFLGSGIDAKIRSKLKKQPIYIAAEKGFKNCYQSLLKYNGNENCRYSSLGLHVFGVGKSAKELMEQK